MTNWQDNNNELGYLCIFVHVILRKLQKWQKKIPKKLIENLKFINRCQNLILIT
jgi:hypothetical protein